MEIHGTDPLSGNFHRKIPSRRTQLISVTNLDNLPGEPFSVRAFGVDPIDLANFVSKTQTWDDVRVAALRKMIFQEDTYGSQVVVYRVRGELAEDSEVLLEAKPYVVLSPSGDRVNPEVAS